MTDTGYATESVRFELRYRAEGTGPAVVLIHPFPADARVFDAQQDAAQRGDLPFQLMCPDLPGFGETPFDVDGRAVLDVLDVDVLAESIANLICRAYSPPAPVVVGGVAIGGYIAIQLAKHHPELVRALVLSGCKAAPDSPSMRPERERVAQLAREQGSAAVAEELYAKPFGPNASDELKQQFHDMIASEEPAGMAGLVLGLAQRPDPTETLQTLEVPVLVIGGTADPFVPVAETERLARTIPNASLVKLDGIGHLAPLEAPDQFTAALQEFVAGATPAV